MGCNFLDLSVNLKGTATQEMQNGWSPPPHTKEDLGLTPLEARSVGVPCIATLDGGISETAGPHALFCKPGCVNSLTNRLQDAVDMSEKEYQQKVLSTKEGLYDYVRPLDQYAENYLQLLKMN